MFSAGGGKSDTKNNGKNLDSFIFILADHQHVN